MTKKEYLSIHNRIITIDLILEALRLYNKKSITLSQFNELIVIIDNKNFNMAELIISNLKK